MNKKILIASLFATLMLLVPINSVVGISDVEEDYGVSKNSLEITEEVEKSEVNKQNDYDCLPCALKENILNNLHFSLPVLKFPFILCFIVFSVLFFWCQRYQYPPDIKECEDEIVAGFWECWLGG